MMKVAETLLAQMGAGLATSGKEVGASEEQTHQWGMAMRKRDGICLFVFAIEHSQVFGPCRQRSSPRVMTRPPAGPRRHNHGRGRGRGRGEQQQLQQGGGLPGSRGRGRGG